MYIILRSLILKHYQPSAIKIKFVSHELECSSIWRTIATVVPRVSYNRLAVCHSGASRLEASQSSVFDVADSSDDSDDDDNDDRLMMVLTLVAAENTNHHESTAALLGCRAA